MAIYIDEAPHVAGTVITLTVLAYLTFILRVYTRVTKATWGLDDWCMAVAALPFAVLSIACIVSAFTGVGVHANHLTGENAKYAVLGLKWFFFFEVFYCIAIIPIKLSIAFTIIRIAQGRKAFVYSQYIVSGMFTIMNLIAALYIILRCRPVSAAWNTENGECDDSIILTDIYYATTAVNIATDWFTAAMPIPLLWNVKLNLNAKISVAGILGLGIFASLSACIRLKYTINLTNSDDYLYAIANILIWGYAENGIGMIVGNVSTLRPLFRKLFNLGGSDSDTPARGLTTDKYAWPSNARRTYKEFETGYELDGEAIPGSSDKFGGVSTETRIRGRGSVSSDSESQKQILDSEHGIMVSRNVEITRG